MKYFLFAKKKKKKVVDQIWMQVGMQLDTQLRRKFTWW